jgi:hypothetical protein
VIAALIHRRASLAFFSAVWPQVILAFLVAYVASYGADRIPEPIKVSPTLNKRGVDMIP